MEGQDESTPTAIKNLIIENIVPQNVIIVAVCNSQIDIATSDALSLAKQVDPHGDRTICVLTKVDLLRKDKGKNPLEKMKKLKNFCEDVVAVVSTPDVDEVSFFSHPDYKDVHDCMGTEYLQKLFHDKLIKHLEAKIPKMADEVRNKLAVATGIYSSCEVGSPQSKHNTFIQIQKDDWT